MIQFQLLVLFLLSINFVFGHSFKFNHLTGPKICSFAVGSIDVQITSNHPNFSTPFIIFHHLDTLSSNIPDFVHFNGRNLQKCSDAQSNNTCAPNDGYVVKFHKNITHGRDEVFNAVFNKSFTEAHYEISNKGFYCLYIDSTQPYRGHISFSSSYRFLSRDMLNKLSSIRELSLWSYLFFFIGWSSTKSRLARRIKLLVMAASLLENLFYGTMARFVLDDHVAHWVRLIKDITLNFFLKSTLLFQIFGASAGNGVIQNKNWFNSQTVESLLLIGGIVFLDFKRDRLRFHEPFTIPFHDFYLGPRRLYLSMITILFKILAYITMVVQSLQLRRQVQLPDAFKWTIWGLILWPVLYVLIYNLPAIIPATSAYNTQFSAYEDSCSFKVYEDTLSNFRMFAVMLFEVLYLHLGCPLSVFGFFGEDGP